MTPELTSQDDSDIKRSSSVTENNSRSKQGEQKNMSRNKGVRLSPTYGPSGQIAVSQSRAELSECISATISRPGSSHP